MGFKENLMQKIAIDKLARQVAASVEQQADAAKFDKEAARQLIEMGGAPCGAQGAGSGALHPERRWGKEKHHVLDNGLAIYDKMHNTLEFIHLEDDLEHYLQILKGDAPPDAEGAKVFKRLKALVMDRKPVLNGTA